MGTLLCEASFEGRYGVQGWYLPQTAGCCCRPDARRHWLSHQRLDGLRRYGVAVGDRFDTVRVSAVSAYPTSCLGCQNGNTDSLLIALESAMANGLLNEPAAWGQQRLVGHDGRPTARRTLLRWRQHERSVAAVLKAPGRSRGPIHLRVHVNRQNTLRSCRKRVGSDPTQVCALRLRRGQSLNAAALRSVVSLQNGTGHAAPPSNPALQLHVCSDG